MDRDFFIYGTMFKNEVKILGVKIQINGKTVMACLEGEIDHHSAREIREEIDKTAYDTGCELLLLDFALVTFMDSSGIGLVMGRYKLMNELSGELQVINTSAHITKVMRLAGIQKLKLLDKEGK